MNYLNQVQIGIDFIESRLDFDISLAEVATTAGISQWHFQRIFKALTNETLKTYIRSRRLANSLDKLLTTQERIIDIALSAGFESQESFSRVFKKTFNITPNEYRKLGDKNLFLKKIQFNTEYLKHINGNLTLKPKIVTQNKKVLVGLKTCFYSVDSEKNNIADKLPPLWEIFLERMDEIENRLTDYGYGVVQQTKEKTDLLEYIAAFEVSELGELPDDMVSIEIPASTYAIFTHRGNVNDINNTVNYIYSSWLLQSDMQHTYDADLELYGADYQPDSESTIMHYAIPIKLR